ncbi:MAG: carbamoyltransferase HypF [Firmicutes bacterium]|nr:carbamoyltransferase HypF [Bacillota bacterium]
MTVRVRLEIGGIVQGVGFRPFVYRLAREHDLTGWVFNHAAGVTVEAEGEREEADAFIAALREEPPYLAAIDRLDVSFIPPAGDYDFRILDSAGGSRETLISPDMATCADCLADMRNPADRRYRYAFTNCTNCGPRFTIIKSLPYDRPRTTMAGFPMCDDCAAEYHDPADRRFHAQPVACPACGPRLIFTDAAGKELAGDPLELAHGALRQGNILAVKGLGGFHLCCDAHNAAAVEALRCRKLRWDRPFALMLPDVETVRECCSLTSEEEAALTGPRRPILLLKRRTDGRQLPEAIAPGNGRLGVMLPYTPLHHLLLEQWQALVMTSGNISDEPIVYEDGEAVEKLSGLADFFLTHNRPIFRRCDDSVAVYAAGSLRLIRRSRGYAPEPRPILDCGRSILACGGQQKNAFCLTRGGKAFLSQHIGDLDNLPTLDSFRREIGYFTEMFNAKPVLLAADKHPDYLATRFAKEYRDADKLICVQHHHAHLASVLAEQDRYFQPAIGLIFDGTGLGDDGTLWGGEALIGDCVSFTRAAHLLPLPLLGGEQAVREPWRQALAAAALAFEQVGKELPSELARDWPADWPLLLQAGRAGINAPLSSGMGRLFDAAAALCGVCPFATYEGQAAVEFEQKLNEPTADEALPDYEFDLLESDECLILDWRPLIRGMIGDRLNGASPSTLSYGFHRATARACLDLCRRLREKSGMNDVALSGGCWQNVWLLEEVCRLLDEAGFNVMTNRAVPCNDGGLSYGQAAVAAARIKKGVL